MGDEQRTEPIPQDQQDDDTGEAYTVEAGAVPEVDASQTVNGGQPGAVDDDDTADSDVPASFAPASVQPNQPSLSTEAMPAPQPMPQPIREHVEVPQAQAPVQDAAQSAQEQRKARHAAVPMPDLRPSSAASSFSAADEQSRNEFTTVYDILDHIEATINEAKAGFFTPSLVRVDRDELNGQLEQLKKMLPVQLERASALMREAERRLEGAQTQANAIVAAAQSRASDMIKDANERAQFLAGQENVVALAQAKARSTMDTAQAKADRLTSGADKYCVDVMESLDQQLDKLKQDVNAGLNVLYARQREAAQDYEAEQAAIRAAGTPRAAGGASQEG